MKSVLHINSYYEHSHFYKNLFDEQIKKGIICKVYMPSNRIADTSFEYGDYTHKDVCFNTIDRAFFHLKHEKIYQKVRIKYDWNEINLIHAHSLFSNGYIALKIKKDFNIPYIVAVRNTDVNVFFKRMLHLRNLGIKILKEADKIIFISQSYLKLVQDNYVPKDFIDEFLKKSIVIPNGIDDYYIKNINYENKIINNDYIKFLYVGDINKNKNIRFVAECIDTLKIKKKLTIIGTIKDKNIYKNLTQYDFVEYIPPQRKENLIHYYRNSDIFIMPSITETFGLVYVEAMSQGTPVIYTKGQGFDDQFENGKIGYAVNANSEKEIINAIFSILNNYAVISKNCITLSQKFNWSNIEKKYANIYNTILGLDGE